MNSINRKQIADQVFFSSIKDSRFKTMKISTNIILPLNEQSASANALLSSVLTRSCKAYPDFTLLSKKLSSLYGAELSGSVCKMGDNQVLQITASGLDDRYTLNSESIARELSLLICGVIFEPNVENNAFKEDELNQERRQLLDLIDSEFNDKRIYANNRMTEIMFEDEVFGVSRYGSADKINEVTLSSLYETWKNVLRTAKFEIIYIGDSPSDKAEEVFTYAFKGIERKPAVLGTQVKRKADNVKRVTDEMELSQSKLVMGFRTDTALPDTQTHATRLMCAILGGTANSKLFCNVREKQSLCYYCGSRYNSLKGIMAIDSGVEGDNIEKAEQGILKEIEDMKNGVISDFEISATKLAMINSFKSSNDTVSGIEAWYNTQLFDEKFKTVDEVSALINAVSKEEIVEAANRLTLDTIYVLKNK